MEQVKVLNVPDSRQACPDFFATLNEWQATGLAYGSENLFIGRAKDLEGRLTTAKRIPPGSHLLLPTSGSSSDRPRLVVLSRRALQASEDATSKALGGPGNWALLLPLAHIAGMQVALRALRAGEAPIVPASWPKVDLEAFGHDLAGCDPAEKQHPLYTSLVSAQLAQLLEQGEEVLAGFRSFDAILVGGGRLDPELIQTARSLGLRVVTTYGMTETAGGCVYDGKPLPGTRLEVDDLGQILISTPSLMESYLDQETKWRQVDGELFWETGDLGRLSGEGVLQVTGRADSIVKSGGIKVDLDRVERALAELGGILDAACAPVPDAKWGQIVGALVVTQAGVEPGQIHLALRRSLPAACVPRVIVPSQELPRSPLGKVRRGQVSSLIAEALRDGRAWTHHSRGGVR